MRRFSYSAIVVLLALTTNAQFVPGDLALVRLGDGSQVLATTGNTIFLDEYSTAGAVVSSTKIPDTGFGTALIINGTATSEGALSLSADGHHLTIAGYQTNRPFGSSVSGATSTALHRGV